MSQAGAQPAVKSRKLNITYKQVLKYAAYAVILLILSVAEVAPGVRPFAFGFFFALVFAGQNLLLISGIYLAATVAVSPSLDTLLISGVTAVVLVAAQLIHIKIKVKIRLPHLLAYAFLSQAGFLVVTCLRTGNYIRPVVTVTIGLIFMYACALVLRCLFVKGMKYKLNAAETACAGIMIAAFSCGLSALNIYGFETVKAVAAFTVLVCTYSMGGGYTLGIACLMGLGAAVGAGNTAYMGGFALMALLALIFTGASRYLGAAALLLADIIYGFYFNSYGVFNALSVASTLLGAIVICVVPMRALNTLAAYLFGGQDKFAMRYIVNRSREDISRRIGNISGVFSEMETVFSRMVKGVMPVEEAKAVLAAEVPDKYCYDCQHKGYCHGDLAKETQKAFADIIEAGINKGKATVIDIPPFIVSRCSRTGGLISALNQQAGEYRRYAGTVGNMDQSRLIVGQQLGGVAQIMESMSADCGRPVSFDVARERRIMEELAFLDVICSESVISRDPEKDVTTVTLVLQTATYKKENVVKAVSAVCGHRMSLLKVEDTPRAGFSVAILKTAPRYDVVFGSAVVSKAGSEISGDTHSFIKISDDKFMIALCDGMGSGGKANAVSELAIPLTENLYKAGFEHELILSSVNKLISLGGEESFTALDICVMDLRAGTADFIKIGAPFGAFKHKNESELIEAGSLPLGILEEMRPCISRKVLTGGDIVVMTSDGVTDIFPSQLDYINLINNDRTLNPQTLADNLLNFCVRADKLAPHDDMTVIAARIFAEV